MRKFLNKKANVQMILTGITVLFIAAFLLIMGLIMMDEMLITTSTDSAETANETLTTVDELGEVVANAGKCGFNNMRITRITNETNINPSNHVIDSANYTIDARSGRISFVGADLIINNTNWNVTYTYNYGANEACEATNQTIGGQGEFADYIDLIVLTIVVAVIISLITIAFGMKKVQ